jgi:hypothetical protein
MSIDCSAILSEHEDSGYVLCELFKRDASIGDNYASRFHNRFTDAIRDYLDAHNTEDVLNVIHDAVVEILNYKLNAFPNSRMQYDEATIIINVAVDLGYKIEVIRLHDRRKYALALDNNKVYVDTEKRIVIKDDELSRIMYGVLCNWLPKSLFPAFKNGINIDTVNDLLCE